MSMTFAELSAVVTEARSLLTGRELLDLRDAGADVYCLIFRAAEDAHPRLLRLLVSVRPGFDRLHLTPRPSPRKRSRPATSFASRVREALIGSILEDLGLQGRDRVVRMAFRAGGGSRFTLVAELIGRHANLLLLDGEGVIVELVRRFLGMKRSLRRGVSYEPLPPPRKSGGGPRKLRFEAGGDPPWPEAPLNGAADAYFGREEARAETERLRGRILKVIARRVASAEAMEEALARQLGKAQHAEDLRRMGDLLQAHFHLVKRGQAQVTVTDHFSEKGEAVTIPLDPSKDPGENIRQYYKRYRKMKDSVAHLESRIEMSRRNRRRLAATAESIANQASDADRGPADDEDGGEALRRLAAELGVLEAPRIPSGKGRKALLPDFDGRRFRSSDGLAILVGKDGPSNDRLTFRIARGNDTWLHAQGAGGSHVVIRPDGRKPVPLNSLLDGARLAVYYSKLRGAVRAEVIYTQRKHVRRIRGAPPGRVQVDRFRTLEIRPSPDDLRRLLDCRQGTDPVPSG